MTIIRSTRRFSTGPLLLVAVCGGLVLNGFGSDGEAFATNVAPINAVPPLAVPVDTVSSNVVPINTVPAHAAPVKIPVNTAPIQSRSITNAVSVLTNTVSALNKDEYVISVGDKLNYRVLEDREEGKVLAVSAAGEIEIPYLGRVVVAGRTVPQACEEIKAVLEKEIYQKDKATVVLSMEEMAPKFLLTSAMAKPRQIMVVGQVKSQGMQDMPVGEKYMLSRAILKAAGFGSFANSKKVVIVRKKADGKTEQIIADVDAVLKNGEVDKDIELQPDDMVIVREKLINF